MALLLSNQVANGSTNVNQIPKNFSEWKEIQIELSNISQTDTVWNASKELYESLENENSIAYTLIPWSKVYKDSEWKEVLLSSPKWVVIRNKAINQKESNSDFLCIEYRWHKAWISTKSLKENKWQSFKQYNE